MVIGAIKYGFVTQQWLMKYNTSFFSQPSSVESSRAVVITVELSKSRKNVGVVYGYNHPGLSTSLLIQPKNFKGAVRNY